MRLTLKPVYLVPLLSVAVQSFATEKISSAGGEMALIPGGQFEPFDSLAKTLPLGDTPKSSVSIDAFLIDKYPVTNKAYLNFLKKHWQWKKSKIKKIFADSHYLETWPSDLSFAPAKTKSPVILVSWFAASSYCEALNKHLPTTHQWEFALFDKGRNQEKLNQKILDWYGRPSQPRLSEVGAFGGNGYGVFDLGCLIWEWTQDFNSFLSPTDSRDGGKNANLFCGNGAQLGNPNDYAAFMRYSFRSSLKANFSIGSLGFRCAKEIKNEGH